MNYLRAASRFSLRTFFLVLIIVSLPVGWIGMHVGANQRESAALAQLSEIVGPLQDSRSIAFMVM